MAGKKDEATRKAEERQKKREAAEKKKREEDRARRDLKQKEAKELAEKEGKPEVLRQKIVEEACKVTKGERVGIQLLMAYCRQLEAVEGAAEEKKQAAAGGRR